MCMYVEMMSLSATHIVELTVTLHQDSLQARAQHFEKGVTRRPHVKNTPASNNHTHFSVY